MSLLRSVGLHGALGVVAAVTALTLWTKDEEPMEAAALQVQVWAGKPDQLESIKFESKDLKVRVEPKQDEVGPWYVVHLNKMDKGPLRPRNPHAPPTEEEEEPKPSGKWVQSKFVSVKEGRVLAETLAPLQALRAVGRIEKAREEEFGFDKPEGTLVVKLAGTEHTLSVGGLTPGGGDRYVRLAGTNEAYAVPGEALRGLLHPESRLLEGQLHGFDPAEVRRLKVTQKTQSRELLKMEGKEGWASLSTPLEQDETASNWMTKVQRLRVKEYLEQEPKNVGQEAHVVRIEYFDGKKSLGFMDLFKVATAPGAEDKDRYLVRTENTRWYAEVLASTAEQIERDLGSVVQKPQP